MATTAASVRARTFTRTRWREGYVADEVDAFLERVARTLEAGPAGSDPVDADTVVQVRFSPTKFRAGYDQDEVDDFLDEVVTTLRQVPPGGQTPSVGTAPRVILTSTDASSRRFDEVRYREGYVRAEVDAFMAVLVTALAAGENGGRSQDHLHRRRHHTVRRQPEQGLRPGRGGRLPGRGRGRAAVARGPLSRPAPFRVVRVPWGETEPPGSGHDDVRSVTVLLQPSRATERPGS